MWKRLLVPHDFSMCAARALDVAVELAVDGGAQLTLLHVSSLPPNVPRDAMVTPPGASAAVRADVLTTAGARRELEAIAAPLSARGLSVRTLAIATEAGDASTWILRVAEEIEVDAIVLGTHGRKGLSHLLLGSVAEKVVRGARVPVVTVRSVAPEAKPTREESLVEDEVTG